MYACIKTVSCWRCRCTLYQRWLRSRPSTLLLIRRSHSGWINLPQHGLPRTCLLARWHIDELELSWGGLERGPLPRHEAAAAAAAAATAAVMWISWTNKEGDKQQHEPVFLYRGKMLYAFVEATCDMPAKIVHGSQYCTSLPESRVHFVTPVQN